MTKELKDEINRMAEKHEKSWVSATPNDSWGTYSVSILDMAYDNDWSYPAYLLLKYTWNDALDWANKKNKL